MDLVKRLTKTYKLYHKNILEIGCGKGDFLNMICDYGENKGYGFDKSYNPELNNKSVNLNVKFIQDYYSRQYSCYPADMIITRYVLEHISDPYDFLLNIKNSTGTEKEIIYYFEVPNMLHTLRDLGIWDLIYEHCNYYTAPSLVRLFENHDFRVLNVNEAFRKQLLFIEASTERKSKKKFIPLTDIDYIRSQVDNFAINFNMKINVWRRNLNRLHKEGKKCVVWGGGAKGVSFLNFVDKNNTISHIVDINPRKSGMYIAGTGQQYILPSELSSIRPDCVVVMNPAYHNEIAGTLARLELSPEILVA